MISFKNKKAAMEMSVGTIVTIVLLMSVLVLGIFLVQKIFDSSTSAIDSVDGEISSQINQMFSDGEAKRVAIHPSSRKISVKRGANPPQGFAFSVYNEGTVEAEFEYELVVGGLGTCEGAITEEQARSFFLMSTAPFSLGGGQSLSNARLVTFPVSKDIPSCTLMYDLVVLRDGAAYETVDLQVTFK